MPRMRTCHPRVMSTEDRDLVEQLTIAAEHRAVIGMAIGMLMERLDVSREDAFGYLRRVSSLQNRKLYEIAREFVQSRELPNV